jgi:hypothetical protein
MTIKFICSCGKHLKARDEMAARRSVCPRCGSPVGIPSQQVGPDGTIITPMTPMERLRHARARGLQSAPQVWPKSDPDSPQSPEAAAVEPLIVRLLASRGSRHLYWTGRNLEKNGAQCLLYPLHAWRLCLSAAIALTLLSALVALILPSVLANPPSDVWALTALVLTCCFILILIVGFVSSFLECALASATAGEVYYLRGSGRVLLAVLFSGVKWLICFLAGPIVIAAVGVLYWLNCGDIGWFDALILLELGVVAFAWWIVALLSAAEGGRLRDLSPLAVADLAHRLGWRGLLGVVLAAGLILAHGWVLLGGAMEVHHATATGWLLLLAGWASGLFWGAFFCRLLGVWCYRTRMLAQQAASASGGCEPPD